MLDCLQDTQFPLPTCEKHIINTVPLSCSGVYSPDDYHVAVPMAVILLPSEGIVSQGALFSALPSDLQHYLQQQVRKHHTHAFSLPLAFAVYILTDHSSAHFQASAFVCYVSNKCFEVARASSPPSFLLLFTVNKQLVTIHSYSKQHVIYSKQHVMYSMQ